MVGHFCRNSSIASMRGGVGVAAAVGVLVGVLVGTGVPVAAGGVGVALAGGVAVGRLPEMAGK